MLVAKRLEPVAGDSYGLFSHRHGTAVVDLEYRTELRRNGTNDHKGVQNVESSPRPIDRLDKSGSPVERFVAVSREVIEANGWDCCLATDEAANYPDVLDEKSALVPIGHWFDHELADLSNSQLAEILVSPVITAGARHSNGTYPQYSELDMRVGTERQTRARQVLIGRGIKPQDVDRISLDGYWPDD